MNNILQVGDKVRYCNPAYPEYVGVECVVIDVPKNPETGFYGITIPQYNTEYKSGFKKLGPIKKRAACQGWELEKI